MFCSVLDYSKNMDVIKREMFSELKRCASFFPVVTILGPRQSGKTTLAKSFFKNHSYINLEDPEFYDIAKNDINGFFNMIKTPVIIDEVQRVPELLSKIQVLSDKSKRKGEFILTGSFQQGLKSAVSQSLAGRTAILNLLPFSIHELESHNFKFSRDELLYQGFMPRLYSEGQPADLLYRSYFQTYVERDVQTILNVKNKDKFEKFLKLLAGRIGQIVNYESLANDTGISSTTIAQWISILESSFIIFKLEPFFENYTKRLVKSPKIYFYEPGLVSYLLGIKNPEQAERDPLIGNLFENMVVVDILKNQYAKGHEKSLYYFRDSKGFEIDLIIADGRKIIPVEIKSAATFNKDFSVNLKKFAKFSSDIQNPTVIYSGETELETEGIQYMNFRNCGRLIN